MYLKLKIPSFVAALLLMGATSCITIYPGQNIPYMSVSSSRGVKKSVKNRKPDSKYCFLADEYFISSAIRQYRKDLNESVVGMKDFIIMRRSGLTGDCLEIYGTPVKGG